MSKAVANVMKLKTPKLVVSGVIKKGNKYLLVKEIIEDKKAYWIIPGGKVEFGESLEEAVAREIKEELGLEVEIIKYLNFHQAIFPKVNYHTIIFFFLLKPLTDSITLEAPVLEAKYYSREEIEQLSLVSSAKWLFENLND